MPKGLAWIRLARIAALAIAAVACAVPAWADTYKIGVLNVEQILRQSKAAQAAQARLEQEFKGRDADLSRKEQEIQAAAAALEKDRPTLSTEEAARRARDVEAGTREVQRLRQQFAEDLRTRQFDELDKLKARLDQVLTKYAKDNHSDLILQDAAFVGPAVNITGDVIKALESTPDK